LVLMKSSVNLGKIMGIPIGIHYSWLIIFFLITATLGQYFFPWLYPNWSTAGYWIIALSTSLLFFASLLAHELAHGVVAVRSGIEVKGITLFIFGGAARISREATAASTELLMAVAGPVTSVGIAGVFALIWLVSRHTVEPLAAMSIYLCWVNLALAAFNMLPGFPLDGGRVLRSIIWWRSGSYRKATRIAALIGQALGCLLILTGLFIAVFVYWFNGAWLALLGAFLFAVAWASYRQAVLRDSVQGLTAQELMIGDCQIVPGQLTIEMAVNQYFLSAGHRLLLVGEWGRVSGIVTLQDTKLVPKRRWHITPVAETMTPVEKLGVVDPGDDGLTVLDRIQEGGIGLLLVVSGDRVVGVIERARLLELGRARSKAGV
jgi:Zn-dependent protease